MTQSHPKTLALNSADSVDRTNLNASQTVVIWLQTTFVSGPNGDFLCLIRNSTPNLDDSSQYVPLATLKSQLEELSRKNANASFLLLVDATPTNSEWRAGCLHSSLVQEFEQWTTDLKKLVVVLSSPLNGQSTLGQPGSDGKSIFGHFASVGLSTLADRDPDQKLSTSEFCTWVAEQTDKWVREHRNVAGQAVTVLPTLKELSNGARAFTVVADLVPLQPADAMPRRKSNVDFSSIEKLWTRRESQLARGGYLWDPLLWNSVTDDLMRLEREFLCGKTKSAEQKLTELDRRLSELESLTESICPTDDLFIADRGISFTAFNDLPSRDRVRDLFKGVLAKPVSGDIPVGCEDVINSHVRGFPFGKVNLPVPPDPGVIKSRRAAAEKAVAQLLGCSDQLSHTVNRMETMLLLSEDRLFIRQTGADAATSDETVAQDLINTFGRFAEARDRAETTLFGVLDLAPSLAYWAADTGSKLPDSERKIWHRVLWQNSPEADLSPNNLNAMFDPLKEIEADNRDGISTQQRLAADLRSEVFRLLSYGRALQQSLLISEPESGFSSKELQAVTAKIVSTQADAGRSQRKVRELAESLCTSALDDKPATRAGQVQAYDVLRSTLSLTAIKAETRITVLRALLQWDEKFASPVPATELSGGEQNTAGSTIPVAADEALWMLQVLNLVPKIEKQSEQLATAWRAAKELDAGDVDKRHDTAAGFGEAIRNFWQKNQDNVAAALQDSTANAHALLRTADQQARLFSGFDAKNSKSHSLSTRLRQVNRIQYCLMHAHRILSGLWIKPNDSAPLVQNGWYAKAARSWLNAATESAQSLSEEARGVPATINNSLQKLKTRLDSSDQLKLSCTTRADYLNLGEQSAVTGTIHGSFMVKGDADVSGEAVVLIRVESGSPIEVKNNAIGVRLGRDVVDIALEFQRHGNPGTEGCVPIPLRSEVFFRGRFTESASTMLVDPCEPEKFTIEKPARPLTASVTVSGIDPRPVVLILDYSSSMEETLTDKPDTARFEEALSTLNDLVKSEKLTDSRVILNVYGHRVKYDPDAAVMVPNPNYVKCFRKPIPPGLNALDDIETEFDGTIGTPDTLVDFNKVIENLRCSKPFGITPLIKAITDALDVDLKNSEGIVIAVTDGEASDSTPQKMKLLEAALKNKVATSVNIVAFDLLKKPFQKKKLQTTFDPFKINVTDAAERDQLLNQIIELLGPRSYMVTGNDGLESRTTPLGTEATNLSPGNDYVLRFSGISTVAPISLQPGDLLKLDFNHSEKRFVVRRDKRSVRKAAIGFDSADDAPRMLRSIVPPRLSNLPEGRNSEMRKAELSVMLDHDRDDLPVRQPAEIEFALRPASSDSSYRARNVLEVYSSRTGAPGWDLTINEWPKEQLFVLDAIWKMERTTPEYVLRWSDLKSFDAIDNSFPIKQTGLPDCRAWITLRGKQLQIRLDPVAILPETDQQVPLGDKLAKNQVTDIRVEIGKKDTSDQNKTFIPWEINTKVVRLETGSVRFEFSGDHITPESLSDAQIAFTSSAARKAGAVEVKGFPVE